MGEFFFYNYQHHTMSFLNEELYRRVIIMYYTQLIIRIVNVRFCNLYNNNQTGDEFIILSDRMQCISYD